MPEQDVMKMSGRHTAVLGGQHEKYEKGPMNARVWVVIMSFVVSRLFSTLCKTTNV